MDEPKNPERYYIAILPGEKDGKKGKVKIKKWSVNGKVYEKEIDFTPYPWEVGNGLSEEHS